MKNIGKTLLNYAQIIVAFLVVVYLRSMNPNPSVLNDLGYILAIPTTTCIVAGFLNRISDDWAGFTVVAIMIYALVIFLKMKFLVIGFPAALGLICVFYFPSGMNMERIRVNREKELNNINNENKGKK